MTPYWGNVALPAAVESLEQDLDSIWEWVAWQIPLNKDKCAVMHFGRANRSTYFSLLGIQIPTICFARPRGLHQWPEVLEAMHRRRKRANKILGYTGRLFTNSDKEIILIPTLWNNGYRRRLDKFKLFTREKWRVSGQLIKIIKTLKDFDNVDFRNLFPLNEKRDKIEPNEV